jgi:ABC-type glutathione transport system ATPase component
MAESSVPVALELDDLSVGYGHPRRHPAVCRHVSLQVPAGETIAIVGESGSGKSTLAKAVVGFLRPRGGRIRLGGEDLASLRGSRLRAARRRIQMVPQDPNGSLDPRLTVGAAIREALDRSLPRRQRAGEVDRLLDTVSLDPAAAERYPHEFSGGQRQRIAIARALAARPDVLVADEITSALDCSVQADILNLIRDLQRRTPLSVLFITHDLAVVSYIAQFVVVLRAGQVVERGRVPDVLLTPAHPYTDRLIRSMPGLIIGTTDPDETGMDTNDTKVWSQR